MYLLKYLHYISNLVCYIPKCTEDVKAIKRIAYIIDVYIILEIVSTLKIGITGERRAFQ